MTGQEMAGRLARLAAEVEEIEAMLNDTAHECPTCGLLVRENYTDYKNKDVLGAARQRLERIAGSLRASK